MNAPERNLAGPTAAEQTELDRLLSQQFRPQQLMHGDSLDRIERIAIRMAAGHMTVPEYLRDNVSDCMAIAIQAMLWGMDPFAVAQKTHIVSGKLGYEAQLVNAVLQTSGAVRNAPVYEYHGDGDTLQCRVGCVLRGETTLRWGEWLSIKSVSVKNSGLWRSNPRQQIGYLQVKNWARAFAPGAILGVYTVDELVDGSPLADVASAVTTSTPPAPVKAPDLPAYADKSFEGNLPSWTKAVVEGKKTVEELIAMISTRGVLSESQKKRLRAIEAGTPQSDPPEPPAAPPAADETDPFVADMERAERSQGGGK